jgi:hypothetical protein
MVRQGQDFPGRIESQHRVQAGIGDGEAGIHFQNHRPAFRIDQVDSHIPPQAGDGGGHAQGQAGIAFVRIGQCVGRHAVEAQLAVFQPDVLPVDRQQLAAARLTQHGQGQRLARKKRLKNKSCASFVQRPFLG